MSNPEGNTGFNSETQKLHCLITLNDEVGKALSSKAGETFFRAFVTEERDDGEITARFRFRYRDGDSWFQIRLGPEHRKLSVKEQVEHIVKGITEKTLLAGLQMVAGGVAVPGRVVACHYPPEPDDAKKTVDWLFAQGLVEVKYFETPDGTKIPVGKESTAT